MHVVLKPGDNHSFTTWALANTTVHVQNTSDHDGSFSMQSGVSPVESNDVPPHWTGTYTRFFGAFGVKVTNTGNVDLEVWAT